eukprot:2770139-Pleurochrysis_carterae.AAC.1
MHVENKERGAFGEGSHTDGPSTACMRRGLQCLKRRAAMEKEKNGGIAAWMNEAVRVFVAGRGKSDGEAMVVTDGDGAGAEEP